MQKISHVYNILAVRLFSEFWGRNAQFLRAVRRKREKRQNGDTHFDTRPSLKYSFPPGRSETSIAFKNAYSFYRLHGTTVECKVKLDVVTAPIYKTLQPNVTSTNIWTCETLLWPFLVLFLVLGLLSAPVQTDTTWQHDAGTESVSLAHIRPR